MEMRERNRKLAEQLEREKGTDMNLNVSCLLNSIYCIAYVYTYSI